MHTPGGVRCEDCAQFRRLPMYELAWSHYLLAALVAAAVSLPMGFAGAFLLAPRAFGGIFYLTFALLLGLAGGAVVSTAIERVTDRKRGTAMQLIAAASVVAAVGLRLLFGGNLALFDRDVGGALAALAGAVYAWNRLR